MVARSGVLRSDTIPKALLKVVVGDDGGNGAEFYGATHIPKALLRVVVGDDGGTERSLRSDIYSECFT